MEFLRVSGQKACVTYDGNLGPSLTVGEIKNYNIKEKYIPEFSEYIVRQLTTSEYNTNRYEHLALKNQSILIENQHEPEYHRFFEDLKNICNTSTEIASYISENDHQAAKKG